MANIYEEDKKYVCDNCGQHISLEEVQSSGDHEDTLCVGCYSDMVNEQEYIYELQKDLEKAGN